jgi:phosphate transport system permease protein
MVLPYHLYVMATQVPNVPRELPYAIALVLLSLVLLLNVVAILLRARVRRTSR